MDLASGTIFSYRSWCSAAYGAPALQHYDPTASAGQLQQSLLQINLIEAYSVQRLASILLLKLRHDAVNILLPVALLQLHRARHHECNSLLLHHTTPQSRPACFSLHFEPDNLKQDERELVPSCTASVLEEQLWLLPHGCLGHPASRDVED
jgi:hypothetical protein